MTWKRRERSSRKEVNTVWRWPGSWAIHLLKVRERETPGNIPNCDLASVTLPGRNPPDALCCPVPSSPVAWWAALGLSPPQPAPIPCRLCPRPQSRSCPLQATMGPALLWTGLWARPPLSCPPSLRLPSSSPSPTPDMAPDACVGPRPPANATSPEGYSLCSCIPGQLTKTTICPLGYVTYGIGFMGKVTPALATVVPLSPAEPEPP